MFGFVLTSCNKVSTEPVSAEGGQGLTDNIELRFAPPKGYSRVPTEQNSFAAYLRALSLKPEGSLVLYYDGRTKPNNGIYTAVIAMPFISRKDLQQCADAIMRLYGEYQYAQGMYDDIKFNFAKDNQPRYYKSYAKGDYSYKKYLKYIMGWIFRKADIAFLHNQTKKTAIEDIYSYEKFLKYMDWVFRKANTASLYNQTKKVAIEDIQSGDIFIQKGRPYGHAAIVLDVAQDKNSNKVYMLGQSYMPAQETQVLINPMDSTLSPWYAVNDKTIRTPEWTFEPDDLRRF